MSVEIVATVGAATANSFITADEMSAYCDGRLNASTWTEADEQLAALVEATRDISLLRFQGERVNSTQALSWPREDCPNPDSPGIDTVGGETLGDYPSDEIPQRVKDATCELALQYLKAGTTDIAALESTIGIVEKTVGALSTTYAQPHERAQGLARFPRVMAYLAPLLDRGKTGGLEVVRV